MTYSMVVAAFSTTVLCSQQRVTIQTLTECARHCGQMSILNFTCFFTMFLFLLVTREILDFVCFQILQAYYLMIQSFDAVLLNGMQTRWLAPDHFFYSCTSPAESSRRTMEPFWPYARSKENRRRAKDHCSCASTRTEHF